MPTTPSIEGLALRAATPDDIPGLVSHSLRVHAAETLDQTPSRETFEWLFAQRNLDPASDWLVGTDERGEIVVDAGAWAFISEKGARSHLWVEASPGWEHSKAPLLAWAEVRAREQIGAADVPHRTLRFSVEEHRGAHRSVAESLRFEVARTFVDMERDLADLPDPQPLPRGVRIQPWPGDREDEIRLVSNAAFASHWGSLPLSAEEWRSLYADSEAFQPDLSFVAMADGEIVSYCMTTVDAAQDGEMWLSRIGTLPDWQRRGIASALIVGALEAGAEQGFDKVGLDVDESSSSNATVLYQRLGFQVRSRGMQYTKEI